MNLSALASRDATYTCRQRETRLVEFGTSLKSHYTSSVDILNPKICTLLAVSVYYIT